MTYTTTHPWLTFTADLDAASFRNVAAARRGRLQSGHVRRALLRPEVAEELLQVYLVRGALATTAIEGNTLSEDEARRVADGTLRLPPSQEYLGAGDPQHPRRVRRDPRRGLRP